MAGFSPIQLIEEVKKRPGIYSADQPTDRIEKLDLWKEIGAAIYPDWNEYTKATAYDRVLQLQRKWRSLRDAYNRELRFRKKGKRLHKRVYRYFKKLSFLGGYEGIISEDDENQEDDHVTDLNDPLISSAMTKKPRKRHIKRDDDSIPPPEELEMPVFPVEMTDDSETDTDRLFLLSFLPEMRQLPINIKMWTRAQIANIMQEAVGCHYDNTCPGNNERHSFKRQRKDSSD